MAVSPQEPDLLATAGMAGVLRVLDLRTGSVAWELSPARTAEGAALYAVAGERCLACLQYLVLRTT